jgi:hypothetical protein
MENVTSSKMHIDSGVEKANHEVHVMLTRTEKERLRMLAKASGYNTLTRYIKDQIFRPDIHHKLDMIINNLLGIKKEGKKEDGRS